MLDCVRADAMPNSIFDAARYGLLETDYSGLILSYILTSMYVIRNAILLISLPFDICHVEAVANAGKNPNGSHEMLRNR